jgi:hypothetical protein
MKATTLLKDDHAAVKKIVADFRRTTARTPRLRQALMDKIDHPDARCCQSESASSVSRIGLISRTHK